ncbi:unnamed protein product [Parnassius apollo]|uniref:(apollo) hypothetical protein n=1 Tax=Parnassius apollo TaxID=110799 RepID=A0A8S3Y0X3_PARAO|nr:unnamed protein product [Parnassius apollo]
MKTVMILFLASVVIASCQGDNLPEDSPSRVHVVDYNPIGDQLFNNPDNFVIDGYFSKPGNSPPGGHEQQSTGPVLVDGPPQQNSPYPYPYKKYDSPLARMGK